MPSNAASTRHVALTFHFVACLSTLSSAVVVGSGHAHARTLRGVQTSLANGKSHVRGIRGTHSASSNQTFDTSPDCLGWTGSKCHEGLCNPGIGPVNCQDDTYCACAPGHCSTAEGYCVADHNRPVGKTTVFKNARFAQVHLALSCMAFDISTDRMIPENERINIFELAQSDGKAPNYMLMSSDNRCAASFAPNLVDPSVHTPGYPVDLHDDGAPPVPLLLGVRFTSAPPYEGDPREHDATAQVVLVEVVASSIQGKTATLFTDGFGMGVANLVSTQPDGGIDTSGYWVLDPPLPLTLPPYKGPKCTFDCGGHGAGHKMSFNSRLCVFAIVFSCLFCFWFLVFHTLFSCCSRRRR